jgi:hypothetical protein
MLDSRRERTLPGPPGPRLKVRRGRADSRYVEDVALDMSFFAALERVSIVREFVEVFCRGGLDPDVLERLALAAHELLENAAKYRAGGRSRLQLGLQRVDTVEYAYVSVTNRIDVSQVDHLKAVIAEVNDRDDPAVYERVLKRAAARGEGSGLGLARIRFEAELDLKVQFEGQSVSVTAARALSGPFSS